MSTPRKKGGRRVGPKAGTRRTVARPQSATSPASVADCPPVEADSPVAPVEDNRPRRVVLDNNVPGGFRMEPV